jgi:MFS family permease
VSSTAPAVAIGSIRRRLQESIRAFSAVFENPDLRRLLVASSGYVVGEWAYSVALAVYAYRIGGPTTVGLIGLIRMLPAAVTAPIGSMLADGHRRERVLTLVYLLRAAIVCASAVAFFANAPAAILFTLAGLITVVSAVLRPAQWALLPLIARTPEQLASANVASSMIEGVSTLAGPALGGSFWRRRTWEWSSPSPRACCCGRDW